MYVTLEPCSHYGKTPPCTDAVIAAGIARVLAAMVDPDERVSGRGIALLRQAGVQVEVGLCEPAARRLLAAYIKLRTQHRPWVICKWAQTADGYLALPPGAGRWLSGEASRARVQELRAVCDGVCVGIGTVLADDPLLTNRSGAGRQPARLVLDAHLRTPPTCQLVQSAARGTSILPVGHMGVPPMQTELGFHGRDGRGTHGQDARATLGGTGLPAGRRVRRCRRAGPGGAGRRGHRGGQRR
jgi:diaminohydroxyphosphoribosylaminopyrimidine deaminase/5-amino-6-(5-phosphoribosylamino)uracil reductase